MVISKDNYKLKQTELLVPTCKEAAGTGNNGLEQTTPPSTSVHSLHAPSEGLLCNC